MLRLAVLVLLLANLGYYGWSGGWLAPWGLAPAPQSEPERMARQIAPQTLRVLPPGSAGPAVEQVPRQPPAVPSPGPVAATPAAPSPCLQAGPWDEAHANTLRAALVPLPAGSWKLEPVEIPARWMVYMGRFADEDTVARKRVELRALNVPFDRPGAALEPGLSLGRFTTEEAAQRGLADLASHGIRTARVVQERAGQVSFMLRLPAADAALRAQLDALQIAWGDTPPQPCK